MMLKDKLKLYVVTERRFRPEIESVKDALDGGATAIQLRIKDASTREMYEIGKEIREITKDYDALYIVNDRLDVALATDADGVHLGKDDLPVSVTKKIAPDLIVGASVKNLEMALKAESDGADYLGVGSIFKTSTKETEVVGLETLKLIKKFVKIPVVAIGGINLENLEDVLKAGADGVAVVSAILLSNNIKETTAKFRKIVDSFKNSC